VQAFDWWGGDWTPLPPMSSARVGAAAAVVGPLIVVAGGYDSCATMPLNTAEAFSPALCSWAALPPMPTRRYGLVLVSPKGTGLAYAIGGDNGHDVCGTNEVYDHLGICWRGAAPLLQPLAGGKAEAYRGLVYYAGGCDQHEELSSTIWVYSPTADRWSSIANISGPEALRGLRCGRTSFAMASIDGIRDSSGRSSAALVLSGGVSSIPDELFLRDTELVPLVPPDVFAGDASGVANESTLCHAPTVLSRVLPPMGRPRSGCRSLVLWPHSRRKFLPWGFGTEDYSDLKRVALGVVAPSSPSRPFLVILGGETPGQEDAVGMMMQPIAQPAVMSMVSGGWLNADAPSEDASPECRERSSWALGGVVGEIEEKESYLDFLNQVNDMRTSRVAFALVVAPGVPPIHQQRIRRGG